VVNKESEIRLISTISSDLGALKACSQSHPKFIHLVERHLYANITFDNNDVGPNGLGIREFISFLSDNPHITNYIRSMDVSVRTADIQYLEGVASVLRMCSLLNKITLRHINVTWVSLPENFRFAFLDCLRLSSMEAVCLECSCFPMEALDSFKNLKCLSLRRWTSA